MLITRKYTDDLSAPTPSLSLSVANTNRQWKRKRRTPTLTIRMSAFPPIPPIRIPPLAPFHNILFLQLIFLLVLSLSIDGTKIGGSAKILEPDIQLEAMNVRSDGEEIQIDESDIGRVEEDGDLRAKASTNDSGWTLGPSRFSSHWHYSADFAAHFDAISAAPSIQAHISRQSWDRYQQFKEETCRKGAEADMAERRLNSTENPYFHWEENEFHRELRKKLLPQTRDGSFRSLVSSQLLASLDPRLFVSKPKSLCKATRLVDEEDEKQKQAKEEKHMFEDFLINKVFSPTV